MTFKTGEKITSANANTLTLSLLDYISNNDELVIDMKKTTYVGSAGLRCFLIASKTTIAKGLPTIRIINMSDDVFRLFKTTGFVKLFIIE